MAGNRFSMRMSIALRRARSVAPVRPFARSCRWICVSPQRHVKLTEDTFVDAAAQREIQLANMLNSVKKGRLDVALKTAKDLANSGETPAAFIARECSDRSFRAYVQGQAAWEQGVAVSLQHSAFDLPARKGFKFSPAELYEGFWLKEVSTPHEQADSIIRLCRASLSLRGLEPIEACEELEKRAQAGDEQAAVDALAAARDCQLIGRSTVVRYQTGRLTAVLLPHVARTVKENPSAMVKFNVLFQLLLKAGSHFNDNLRDGGPSGPLDEGFSSSQVPLGQLRHWVEARQAATSRQVRIVGEIVSEASTGLLGDEDGLAFVQLASSFFESAAECTVADKRWARQVFKSTADRLQDRLR